MSQPLQGEVIGPSREERFRAAETRISYLSTVLDELIRLPGSGIKVGLDPILGLIPVVGDVVSAAAGSWIILEAARFGIPRVVVGRMVVNLVVDLLLGAIPFFGDIFDFFSRSNSANLALFRRHALDEHASTRGQQAFFVGLLLLLVGIIWLAAVLIAAVVGWVVSLLR